MYVVGDEWNEGNMYDNLRSRNKWFLKIEDMVDSLNPKGGIVYTGNAEFLKSLCPEKISNYSDQSLE